MFVGVWPTTQNQQRNNTTRQHDQHVDTKIKRPTTTTTTTITTMYVRPPPPRDGRILFLISFFGGASRGRVGRALLRTSTVVVHSFDPMMKDVRKNSLSSPDGTWRVVPPASPVILELCVGKGGTSRLSQTEHTLLSRSKTLARRLRTTLSGVSQILSWTRVPSLTTGRTIAASLSVAILSNGSMHGGGH